MSIILQKPLGPGKPVVWMGSSRRDLAQRGGVHPRAVRMRGHLRDVTEVRCDDAGDTFRLMYTIQFPGIVYVLHVFQKKSKSSRSTPRGDLDCIEQRYRAARVHYEMHIRSAGTRTQGETHR